MTDFNQNILTGKYDLVEVVIFIIFNSIRYWGIKFELEADCKVIYDPEKSVFPPGKEIEFWKEKELVIDYDDFRLGDLNWVTFGNLILNLYKYLEDNEYVK